MGKRGFQPQPKEAAIAKGVYRADRYGSLEDSLVTEHLSAVPEPPTMLDEHGSKFWYDMLTQLLKAKGLVMIADLPTFQMMAFKYQVWYECAERLQTESKWIIDDKGNTRENPILNTMEKAEKIFISLAREFGCTPSARNNLKMPQIEEKKTTLEDFKI
jgi:P27 family predicted phage terminase small subunit